MPCLAFLSQLREAYPQIQALDAEVAAVGTGADFQARKLRADGVPFPCLLDPERTLYQAIGLEHIRWYRYLQPTTWRKYFATARRARQGRLTGDVQQAPGALIIDSDRRIRYLYRGTTLGDYPRLEDMLSELRQLT